MGITANIMSLGTNDAMEDILNKIKSDCLHRQLNTALCLNSIFFQVPQLPGCNVGIILSLQGLLKGFHLDNTHETSGIPRKR